MSQNVSEVRRPRIFVVSGPSGVGKDTLLERALDIRPDLRLAISATTRPPRPGEEDGVSYHFVSDAEFDRMVGAGELAEWAEFSGNRYGTPNAELEAPLAEGASVILEIEVQGAMKVRASHPDAVLVFVEPPSLDELARRLSVRATDSAEQRERRLARAVEELALAPAYDARIVNDDLDVARDQLLATFESYER